MEKSEAVLHQERLQAIAEKRKKQTEIENKRRQLEDDRRQLQHLKSKALRERWLLDGAPSAGSEEDEAKRQLQEDEAKTKGLEETIIRLEQELEELETGVSATSTKENLSDVGMEEDRKTGGNKAPAGSVKATYSVEITVERDRLTGETKVLSTNTLLPKDLTQQGVKVYEDDQKVVHEVRGIDGAVENGVHQLSSTEVDELIHKADEVSMNEAGGTPRATGGPVEGAQTPKKEITGIEAKPGGGTQDALGDASSEHPVTMVFMGYQSVEDETETKKVLGLEGTVKAELVVIEDGESKGGVEGAKEDQAPPNGSAAEPVKAQEEGGGKGEAESGAAELNTKEKQPCKCCSIM
ncbi:paralemmin 1a isoform X1 [Brienomyrus brachyistius]|uniref:paralemmin 1a isoform X1 n=1 Tax=Brienomyrus brachyistius TaxID=42636 RepID=UPI0020B24589|nr:paralemmin 1a isoform X1 [Brienomyrus brachyistius]